MPKVGGNKEAVLGEKEQIRCSQIRTKHKRNPRLMKKMLRTELELRNAWIGRGKNEEELDSESQK